MKTQAHFPLVLLGFALALALASCATNPESKEASTNATPTGEGTHFSWNDDGGPGDVKVRINLSSQRAVVTRGGRQIGWSYVATGREGRDTPAGTYRISEKIVDKHSNRYGWIENSVGESVDHDASPGDPVPAGCKYVAAPMPYWMRLTGYGIGMHEGYIPQPGMPASHGCIRLPRPFAPKLYGAVTVGTPVTIEYGKSDSWVVHPDPIPRKSKQPKTRNGLRVVSADDPWIVWPEGHPRAR